MDTALLHPTYFPTVSQVSVMAQANNVIFEVCDNYQKQTYRNRCYVAHAHGKLLLNVPIQHSRDGKRQRSADLRPENHFPWRDQHWKSLQSAYRTSPYFEYYEDELQPLFSRDVNNLLEHNLRLAKSLSELLGIELNCNHTSTYEINSPYIDYRFLVKAKGTKPLELEPYTQVFGDRHGFLSDLSILDLLFNLGPNSLSYLKRQKVPVLQA